MGDNDATEETSLTCGHQNEPSSSKSSNKPCSKKPEVSEACKKHSNIAVEKKLLARIEANTDHEEEDHTEHHDDNHGKNSMKVAFMITMTFMFFLVELTVGFVNRSIALLADSYHMLSDVMALAVALICLQISRRKSKRNGFGWVRAEVLGALVNGVFLLTMCFTISLESVGRIIHPTAMQHPGQVLVVGIIGLLVNLVGIFLFHGSGHGHSHGGGGHGHSHGGAPKKNKKSNNNNNHGHSHDHGTDDHGHGHSHEHGSDEHNHQTEHEGRTVRSLSRLSNDCSHNLSLIVGSGSKQHLALRLVNLDETEVQDEFEDEDDSAAKRNRKMKEAENLNMRGVFLHIISDAVGSVFVIITATLAYFFPNKLGVLTQYMDPGLSLILVTLISISAYRLITETAAIILRQPPSFLDFDDLKKDIGKIQGVADVKELTAWTLVSNRHLATAHVEFCSPAAFDQASSKIRRLFHGIGIHSLTLQPSFSSNTCEVERAKSVEPILEENEDAVDADTPIGDHAGDPLLNQN